MVRDGIRWIWEGYTKRSAQALGVVLCVYLVVGYRWQHLINPSLGMDWLLGGIWAFMTLLLIWRLDLRQDLRLVFVGLVGGAVIEWWGTTTTLWWYFTAERPPLWIIPAWPTAALTIHRLPMLIGRFWPGIDRLGRAYWVALPLFVVAMTRFLWPTIHVLSSQVVLLMMIGITLVGAKPNRDFAMFATGTMLGFFLEYWGTSRYCWTYYTRQIPPIEAVFAHGFAAVAFARMDQVLAWLIEKKTPARAAPKKTAPDRTAPGPLQG